MRAGSYPTRGTRRGLREPETIPETAVITVPSAFSGLTIAGTEEEALCVSAHYERGWTQPVRTAKLLESLVVCAVLVSVCVAALTHCYVRGSTLYYGDAEAHLNIARRILDSRTPGPQQIGTVWLPLPHLLMLPFVQFDVLWRSGLAGAIPSGICFVIAGSFLFAAARRLHGSAAAAAASLGAFALNPNLLYLQTTPMTEPVFFAALGALFHAVVRFHEAKSRRFVVIAGIAAFLASLTRYEGWFLIPFATVFFLVSAHHARIRIALLFGALAVLGPLLWLAHNQFWWGDCLEFLRGAHSPRAIYQRSLSAGLPPYPGAHDWFAACRQYWSAVNLSVGVPLLLLAAAGVVSSLKNRGTRPLVLLLLLLPTPLFYVWTVHSGGIPMYIPQRWPYTAYNTRYGLAALPLLALAVGALVAGMPVRWRAPSAALATALALGPWMRAPWPDVSICWREARDTSGPRRAWTHEGATFLRQHYHSGEGIFMSFGDLTGILREAGIPLREALIQGDGPDWRDAVARPELCLREAWALTAGGDQVGDAVGRGLESDPAFQCVERIEERGAPTVRIFRRTRQAWAPGLHRPSQWAIGLVP